MNDAEVVVRLDPEEWAQVARLVAPFALGDEAQDLGFVRLQNFQGRRRWVAATAPRLALLDAGPWDQRVDVGLSGRAISSALALCEIGRSPELVLGGDPGRVPGAVVVRGGAARIELPAGPNRYPDVDTMMTQAAVEPHASASLPATELDLLVAGAREMPAGVGLDDDDQGPLFWVSLGEGALNISTNWGSYGIARYSAAAAVEGRAAVAVNPRFLHEFSGCLLRVAGDDEVILRVPLRGGPVTLSAGNWSGYLMPIDTTVERFRPRLELLLNELGVEDPQPDEDGDYLIPLPVGGMYLRLEGADARRRIPDRVQVFGVVLQGVAATPELLAELNDLNGGTGFTRVFHFDDQVLVEVELLAETFGLEELDHAIATVAALVNDLGPYLSAAFTETKPGTG